MPTLVLSAPHQFVTRPSVMPEVPDGHVLLRVRHVGVCGTDLNAYVGKHALLTYPRILGHELGCSVEAVGAGVAHLEAGDQVAVEPLLSCGACYACRVGKSNCCRDLKVMGVHVDGGMTERIVVPADKAHRSRVLNMEQLALLETLTVGAHAIRRGGLQPNETVLILGAGPIGLGALQIARALGARPLVADIADHRLDIALQLGAEEVINPARQDLAAFILDRTDGEGVPMALEAIGNPATMRQTLDLVAPGGRIVLVGWTESAVGYNGADLLRKEVTLFGSRNSRGEFPFVRDLAEQGLVNLAGMVSHRFPLADAPRFFEEYHAGKLRTTKTVLHLD